MGKGDIISEDMVSLGQDIHYPLTKPVATACETKKVADGHNRSLCTNRKLGPTLVIFDRQTTNTDDHYLPFLLFYLFLCFSYIAATKV